MKTNLIYFFYFIILSFNRVEAQTILKGYALDSLGNPLPFVNVFTQQSDSGSIIAFTATNEKGYFSFSTPRPKMLRINATLLGYQTVILSFAETDKIPETLNFILNPQSFVLKEAVVRANGRIIEKSDTVTFKADAFRDSTERNLEELLAKLPGVDIDKNTGAISVQGKPIKKILIEGDDLTGHNYQLMSKNLMADVVDKIQIIDKFNDNKLLRGLKRSDDKVINITLKENRKKLLFGNAIVGFGTDERTNNSLNLFGFYKKLKTITFGNYNTVGQNSTADRMLGQNFKDDDVSKQQRALVNEQSRTFININRTPSVVLGNQHTRFNKSVLGSTHFVVRPYESMSIKGVILLSTDKNKVFTDNSFRYLLRDSIFELNETNTFERKPLVFEGKLDIQTDLSDKALLRYNSFYRKTNLAYTATTLSNRNNILNDLTDKTAYFSNMLDFTYRIDIRKALTINALYSREKGSQNFIVAQSLPRFIPSVNNPFYQFNQIIEKPMNYAACNSQLFYSDDWRKIAVGVGIVSRSEDLLSSFYGMDKQQGGFVFSADSFKNNFIFTQNNYYAHLNWRETGKTVQLFGDLSGGYYQTMIQRESTNSKGYILPTLGLRKDTEKYNLFGTYAFNMNLPQLADITTGLILTDYRSFQRGSLFFVPANSHTLIGNYTHGKFADNFMAYVNIIGSKTSKGYRNDFQIGNDFNSNIKIENTFNNSNLVISGGIERYISNIYARLKIKPTLSLSEYQNRLNESDIRQSNAVSSSVDVSLRSAFLKWFNYHIGATLTQNKVKTRSVSLKNTITNHTIGSYVDLYFSFSHRFRGKIDNEYFYFNQQQSGSRSYYFINSSFDYELIRSRLNITLVGRNLLNTKEFVTSNISDITATTNKVKLLPRYILMEANFKF
jgi:hypothetical protein